MDIWLGDSIIYKGSIARTPCIGVATGLLSGFSSGLPVFPPFPVDGLAALLPLEVAGNREIVNFSS